MPFHQLYSSISWLAKQMSAVCDTMMSPFLNLSVSLSSWFMFALQIGFFLPSSNFVASELEQGRETCFYSGPIVILQGNININILK